MDSPPEPELCRVGFIQLCSDFAGVWVPLVLSHLLRHATGQQHRLVVPFLASPKSLAAAAWLAAFACAAQTAHVAFGVVAAHQATLIAGPMRAEAMVLLLRAGLQGADVSELPRSKKQERESEGCEDMLNDEMQDIGRLASGMQQDQIHRGRRDRKGSRLHSAMDLCRRGYTVVGRPGVECLDRSKRLPKPETTKAYADMNTQLFVLLARRPLLAGFRLLFTADRERVKRADAARNALVRAVGANAGPIQRLGWEKALARNLQQCRAERTQLVWRIAMIDCAVQTLHAHW